MVTTKINNGDSLTYAFTLTGVEAADILHLEFAIGNLSFTLANGKLVQSNTNPLLFYVYLLSKDTFCLNGNYPVSVAVHTEALGVVKKNLLANLSVTKTNTKMNLPVETPVISATFNLTVDESGVIVDEYLQQIAKGEDGLSAYEVAVDNGFVGTEVEWLESLEVKGVPEGGEAGMQLFKTTATDYETNWAYSWEYLVANWSVIPTLNASITGGDVYNYELNGTLRYRFVPTTYTPTQDAFYTYFDGTSVTGLITKRG